MESVMRVKGILAFLSSQAVMRAPWRRGRVSVAMTLSF
jgi:hypothetical protein